MDTRKLFMLKSHFDLVDKSFLHEFVYRTMFWFATSFWALVCNYMFYVFGFIIRYIFRFDGDGDGDGGENSRNIDSGCSVVQSQQDNPIGSNCFEESESDGFGEKGETECSRTSEDFSMSNGETECSVFMETASTSKYQFMPGKHISGFMEKPETMSFTFQKLYVGSNDHSISNSTILDSGCFTNKDFQAVNQEKTEDSAESFSSEEVLEKQEQVKCTGHELSGKGEIAGLEANFLDKHDFSDEVGLLSVDCLFSLDSEPGSINGGMITSTHKVDSISDEILSERRTGEGSEQEIPCLAEISDTEAVCEDDYIELEPNSIVFDEPKDLVCEETESMDNSEKSEEPNLQEEQSVSDSDDEFGFEFLQEHQDLIQQLKMELKNVKTRGLPTILEESESPKIVEDLKPLMIDKKMEHKDRIEEIQKFYKSYAEKMRKLDILNNQTMHAMGLLRLKDPVQLNSTQKSSVPAIKSLLSWNLRTSKVGNHEADPTQKFIRELHRDLEMVYVGQVCLSWEILHWQYGKAQELQDYDSQGYRHYNQVAGEYQQFQVLVQRFVENEPYQGPRIQNYIENRCVLRNNFLQVPAIRDDCLKDKKGRKTEDEYVISSAMLTEIIEESMRLFWEFLRADKDEATVISRGLEDPADLELLMDIQTNLQKKERKLKDLLRSRNCIVKRFQKHQEYQLGRAMFFAQVEMKLVSRVLNMSRLTVDQLVWCHKKLNEINFVSSKVHIEHSFLLFPC